MARIHYWGYLINEEGQPIQSGDLSIYLAESETEAYVYDDETGGSSTNTAPQVTTDSAGFFEFWIGDSNETYGYAHTQKFKIAWEKAGVAEGQIDNIEIIHSAPRYYTENIITWTASATGYYYDAEHNLINNYPIVRVYNTSSGQITSPWKIESISTTVTRIWMLTETNVTVAIVG